LALKTEFLEKLELATIPFCENKFKNFVKFFFTNKSSDMPSVACTNFIRKGQFLKIAMQESMMYLRDI